MSVSISGFLWKYSEHTREKTDCCIVLLTECFAPVAFLTVCVGVVQCYTVGANTRHSYIHFAQVLSLSKKYEILVLYCLFQLYYISVAKKKKKLLSQFLYVNKKYQHFKGRLSWMLSWTFFYQPQLSACASITVVWLSLISPHLKLILLFNWISLHRSSFTVLSFIPISTWSMILTHTQSLQQSPIRCNFSLLASCK